jgi:hypothetical protein
MATDYYVPSSRINSDGSLSQPLSALMTGLETKKARLTFELDGTANATGDVIRILKNVPATMVLLNCYIANDAITGLNDVDLGLYLPDFGAVVDKDCFADGIDLSSGHATLAPGTALNGLVTVNADSLHKAIRDINAVVIAAGEYKFYDLALTFNAEPTAGGTVTIDLEFAQS